MKYTYNEKVKVTNGFYKDYKGTIKDVTETKDKTIYKVELQIEGKIITKQIEEHNLKSLLFGIL